MEDNTLDNILNLTGTYFQIMEHDFNFDSTLTSISIGKYNSKFINEMIPLPDDNIELDLEIERYQREIEEKQRRNKMALVSPPAEKSYFDSEYYQYGKSNLNSEMELYSSKTDLDLEIERYQREIEEKQRHFRQITIPVNLKFPDNLTKLSLIGCNLTSVPENIVNLSKLRLLDLSSNPIKKLPNWIGDIPNLKILNISDTLIESLPEEICNLKLLIALDICDTHIDVLPKRLAELKSLKYLNVPSSLKIPPEITIKIYEPKSILEYYFSHLNKDTRPLAEAKIILVGQGSVGKTSLVNRLLYNSFSDNELKTEGIVITRCNLSRNTTSIRLNIWDFGGQEIMHATHQFFLTKRSLYLLVMDNRLEEEENRIEYWLKIINSFGVDSPIIVIGNKCDQHQLDIDKRGLQLKYPNIQDFVEVSCSQNVGIPELKKVISKNILKLPHIYDRLLLSWFEVKNKFENLKKDFISYHEYVDICSNHSITDENSQKVLIGFLHDLGIVLNFNDDPRLSDTNVINPHWVTNAVYKILNSHALFVSKGILTHKMLCQILNKQSYPQNKHIFIIDIMQKFELCFGFNDFNNESYLIPDLLPKEEPYTGDWHDALRFEYHYDVLPSSIISRFIVRMHPFIYKSTYWRNGVIIHLEDSIALIRSDKEDKKIVIYIHTKQNNNILSAIRIQFDKIHRTIPGLLVNEKIGLLGNPNILEDYKHLETLVSLGETHFVPKGMNEKIEVSKFLQFTNLKYDPSKSNKHLYSNTVSISDKHIKKTLNHRARIFANSCLWLTFIVMLMLWAFLALITWKFGWGLAEPWTYFIGVIFPVCGYLFFIINNKKLSIPLIYSSIIEYKKRQLYSEFGISINNNIQVKNNN